MTRKRNPGMRVGYTRAAALAVLAASVLAAGCQEVAEPDLPTPEKVASYYSYDGSLDVELNGNVAEITIGQPASQLRQGGTLWAKVGPYVFLFTQETRSLIEDYPGLGGVRVITRVEGGPEVARALLSRNELTGVQWRRGLNVAGRARREGTDRPALLDDLVRWGEEHTQFRYNERYTKRY